MPIQATLPTIYKAKEMNPISKKANWNGDIYSYSLCWNAKYLQWRIEEYKNGEFEHSYGEYEKHNKAKSITRLKGFLNSGDTGINIK